MGFESLVHQVNDKFKFYVNNVEVPGCRKPVFFYHVQKSGGLTFSNTLSISLRSRGFKFARADTDEHLEDISDGSQYSLICSHKKFGIHERIKASEHRLVTFLRDPFYRVRSAYTYRQMRAQQDVTEQGFEAFYRDPENQNLACKQLLDGDYYPGCAEAVFSNLERNFFAFATSDRIDDMISYFLSDFELCNVLTENLNQTLDKYKIDASAHKQTVASLNKDDVELYNLVQSGARIPENLDLEVQQIAMKTAVFFEVEKEKASVTNGVEVDTPQLFNVLSNLAQTGKSVTLEQLVGR